MTHQDHAKELLRHFGIMFLISVGVAGIVLLSFPGIPIIPILPFSIVAVLMVDMTVSVIRRRFHKKTPTEKMMDCLFEGDEAEAEKHLDDVVTQAANRVWAKIEDNGELAKAYGKENNG